MTEPKLLTDIRDSVLTLTLNRPEKLNAIDDELAASLLQALSVAMAEPKVRVILLRGKGRAFCAGRDVSAPPTAENLTHMQAVAQAIVACPKPVVAAVHGWTLGAGLEIMLSADIVLAADSARFKLPEASLGVFLTGGVTATLPAAIGLPRAKALAMLGEEFSARQALNWGMVYKVTADDELDQESRRVAVSLGLLAPSVAAQFKRVLNLVGLSQFELAIDEENRSHRVLGNAPT